MTVQVVTHAAPRIALVALGANLGDAVSAIRAAARLLAARAASDFRLSPLYRSAPIDCEDGAPDYVNAAAAFAVRDDETPESLLAFLQDCESAAGRARVRVRNSPRTLDLDLILFADEQRATATLELPHPRAHLRAFVLEPAACVAGDLRWPGRDTTVARLRDGLRANGAVAAEGLVRLDS